jgi:hypothetical protein
VAKPCRDEDYEIVCIELIMELLVIEFWMLFPGAKKVIWRGVSLAFAK